MRASNNSENREQSQTCLNYAEVHPVLRASKNSENRIQYKTNRFAFIVEVHPVLRASNNSENVTLKSSDASCLHVVIILFTLIQGRCKIEKYTYGGVG